MPANLGAAGPLPTGRRPFAPRMWNGFHTGRTGFLVVDGRWTIDDGTGREICLIVSVLQDRAFPASPQRATICRMSATVAPSIDSQSARTLRVLIVGSEKSPLMATVQNAIVRIFPETTRYDRFPHWNAINFDGNDSPPDLAIILQHWPDEFTAEEIRTALSRWPLTRWLCCHGPWCASDGRTRQIWPPALRVTTDDLESRLAGELRTLRGELSPLPATAALDEVFAFTTGFGDRFVNPEHPSRS